MGHRPVAGGGVILERERPSPGGAARRTAHRPWPRGSDARPGSPTSVRPAACRPDRAGSGSCPQGSAAVTGKLSPSAAMVEACNERPTARSSSGHGPRRLPRLRPPLDARARPRRGPLGAPSTDARRPDRRSSSQDRGDAHEARLPGSACGPRATDRRDRQGRPDRRRTTLRAAAAATTPAMRAGADVIYQATFFDGRWRGHADFLLRVERPQPGPRGMELRGRRHQAVARRSRAARSSRCASYADLLERVQGVAPETLYVVTGDGVDAPPPARRLRRLLPPRPATGSRQRVLRRVARPPATYPDPVDHCHVCALVPDVHPAAPRRRPPLDRGRHAPGRHGAARWRGRATLTALAELPRRATPSPRCERAGARTAPRPGAAAAPRAANRRARLRADPAGPGRARHAGSAPCPSRRRRRVLRHRGRPVGPRRRARVPVRRRRRSTTAPPRLPAALGPRRAGEKRGLRARSSTSSSSASTPIRRCTSTTTVATSRARSSA